VRNYGTVTHVANATAHYSSFSSANATAFQGGGGGGVGGGGNTAAPSSTTSDTSLHGAAPVRTITAVVPSIPFEKLAKTDVPAKAVSRDAVIRLYNKGIIKGQGNNPGTFALKSPTNRAEVVTMFGRLLTLPIPSSSSVRFSDVRNDVWYKDALFAALSRGLVKGYPDGTFKGGKQISVVEMLKLTAIASKLSDASREKNGATWYAGYLTDLNNAGMLKGISLPRLDAPATREFVFMLLARVDDYREKKQAEQDAIYDRRLTEQQQKEHDQKVLDSHRQQ
jgi:hypothetical protein